MTNHQITDPDQHQHTRRKRHRADADSVVEFVADVEFEKEWIAIGDGNHGYIFIDPDSADFPRPLTVGDTVQFINPQIAEVQCGN